MNAHQRRVHRRRVDAGYQQYIAGCAKECRCLYAVCAGVLAGGFCDEIGLDEGDRDETWHAGWNDQGGDDDQP